MNIFFDLDGTLINAQNRLYSLFQYLVPESKLTCDKYWTLKRDKNDHHKILTSKYNFSESQFKVFEEKWLTMIETVEYLQKDFIIDNVYEVLKTLQSKGDLYLVTERQNTKNTLSELESLNLSCFFTKIFITNHTISKNDIIKNNCKVACTDYLAGDTGRDVLTGKQLGIKTIAVTYGFLSREVLKTYGADYLIDNITDTINVIK
jgi:phosphoglycolate phosphatase